MFAARPVFRSVSHIKHLPNLRPFSALAANPSSKTQVYISNSRSPYINLSIEHHLLQTTPSDSNVLFLYTNRPSIVIGRNQNPWLEVNLPLLQSLDRSRDAIDLVRRRSGGGTVFHDEGNVNYSVICPPANFNRDKHAEMVCRALHKLGVPDVAVNCRHDIVMTTPSATPIPLSSCTGKPLANAENTYKISGSAYKLTRLRSLHHGTCLLSSPNLPRIGSFLRSPAEPFIKARGVESVRSRIRNVGVEDTKKFEQAVVEEFGKMYGAFDVEARLGEEAGQVETSSQLTAFTLQSREWIYGQTPLFTFSTHPSEEDDRKRPELPGKFKLSFESRHGLIQQFALEGLSSAQPQTLSESMINSQIWEIDDWAQQLRDGGLDAGDASTVGPWLNSLLGKRQV
ncbi:putative lipoate-protein ligase A [Colletotrichum sp. SAR 10_70]|nr:putative lipoate-protein ligase A [Colletotrichum sp. SAR 10_71]KAI8164328.1 putative lipoate-protein ligase A [Colletotrichum sp. SAR 10_70]KAJ4997398.1 putative lipoate-protein ligase A [Colletotrichum sp. SAR 10_66]